VCRHWKSSRKEILARQLFEIYEKKRELVSLYIQFSNLYCSCVRSYMLAVCEVQHCQVLTQSSSFGLHPSCNRYIKTLKHYVSEDSSVSVFSQGAPNLVDPLDWAILSLGITGTPGEKNRLSNKLDPLKKCSFSTVGVSCVWLFRGCVMFLYDVSMIWWVYVYSSYYSSDGLNLWCVSGAILWVSWSCFHISAAFSC